MPESETEPSSSVSGPAKTIGPSLIHDGVFSACLLARLISSITAGAVHLAVAAS